MTTHDPQTVVRLAERARLAATQPPPDDAERIAIQGEAQTGARIIPFPIQLFHASAIFAPLPELVWSVKGLGLAPGAATMVAGYGYSGKTIICQAIALAKAAGRPVWGVFQTNRGRVLHIDYEQGKRLTFERYQRLARGMGIDHRELEGQLVVSIRPDLHLDSPGRQTREKWARIVDGYDIVLIDSLAAATPRTEENDSSVRRSIDMLDAVSETTGALPIVVHHAGKSKPSKPGEERDARQAPRGHSAIFDAFSSVFHLEAKRGEPTTVKQTKDRWRGKPLEDFAVEVEDVEYGGDSRWGLRVRHLEAEQLEAKVEIAPIERVRHQILNLVRQHPELRTKTAICERIVGARKTTKLQAIDELMEEGKLIMMCEGGPYRVAD